MSDRGLGKSLVDGFAQVLNLTGAMKPASGTPFHGVQQLQPIFEWGQGKWLPFLKPP